MSRVNDGTEGGEGTETPRDRREHGERRVRDRRATVRRTEPQVIWSLSRGPCLRSSYSLIPFHTPSVPSHYARRAGFPGETGKGGYVG